MNKIIRHFLPLLILSLLPLALNGCKDEVSPLRYSLTELPLTAEHSVSFEERFYPLPSGEFAVVQGTGTVRSMEKSGRYQIPLTFNLIRSDGTLKYEHTGAVFTTMLLGFDDGRVFRHVFENGERIQYIDDTLRSTASPLLLGRPLYEDRYFAIAEYTPELEYLVFPGSGWDYDIEYAAPLYALYEYDRPLTECKYLEIVRIGDGFLGIHRPYSYQFKGNEYGELYTDVLDSGGRVIRTETGDTRADYTILAYEPPYDDAYDAAYSEDTGKYYYTDPQGRPLSEPLFDNCTGICGGHAIVEMTNRLYLLTVIPE